MPAKGRRVASRQAQLGRRRRRPARPAGSTPPAVAVAAEGEPADLPVGAVAAAGSRDAAPVNGAPARAPASASASASARPSPAPNRADLPMAYTHLGAEVRRILILTGALLAILVVLAVVL